MALVVDFSNELNLIDEEKVEKVVLAKRVGQVMSKAEKGDDVAMLEGVARSLCKDDVDAVRGALSFELRRCPKLSTDIVEAIAFDAPDIAAPFLQTSDAVSDELLIQVVETGETESQTAIARRILVSPSVSDSLAHHGTERAVMSLARNPGAELPATCLSKIAERFENSPSILGELAMRDDVSKQGHKRVEDSLGGRRSKAEKGQSVPFVVLLANLRVSQRLGELSERKIARTVEHEGFDGLEAVLMAVLDVSRRKVTQILRAGDHEAATQLFNEARFSEKLQKFLFSKLGDH